MYWPSVIIEILSFFSHTKKCLRHEQDNVNFLTLQRLFHFFAMELPYFSLPVNDYYSNTLYDKSDPLKLTLLTPWSTIFPVKLTGFQLVKKFPTFYGTRRIITASTYSRYLFLSWASSIQFITQHFTSWRSILLLSSHLHLGLPNGLFPSGFPTKTLYTSLLYPIALHAPPISFFCILSPEQYWMSSTDH